MPWSGTGTFSRAVSTAGVVGATLWASVKALGRKIRTDDHDAHDQDLADGINNALTKDGQNAATGNLNIGGHRLTNVASATAGSDAVRASQIQTGTTTFAPDTGSANAAVLTLTPAIASGYTDGMAVRFRPAATNTGATTLNVNALGAKDIRRRDGSPLKHRDLLASGITEVVFNGSADTFQLLTGGPLYRVRRALSGSDTLTAADHDATIDVTSGSPTLTLTAASTLLAGWRVYIKNSGSGTVTIAPSGADTIDGRTSVVLPPLRAIAIECVSTSAFIEVVSSSIGRQTIGIPAAALTERQTNGATRATEESSSNDNLLLTFNFDPATPQAVQIEIPMPPSYDRGGLYADALGFVASGSGDVMLRVSAVFKGSGDSIDAAFGSAEAGSMTFAAIDTYRHCALIGPITPAGTAATGKSVLLQIERAADASGDTCSGAFKLSGARLFYTTNAPNDQA